MRHSIAEVDTEHTKTKRTKQKTKDGREDESERENKNKGAQLINRHDAVTALPPSRPPFSRSPLFWLFCFVLCMRVWQKEGGITVRVEVSATPTSLSLCSLQVKERLVRFAFHLEFRATTTTVLQLIQTNTRALSLSFCLSVPFVSVL